MINSVRTLTCAVALAVLLAGCGSTPHSNHYVLTATVTTTPAGQSPSLGIGPIEIPEYLNRNGLVYNRKGNQLQIANSERWAEPLEDGISRVLILNLAGLLNTENVRTFPWHPKRPPDYGVKVRVLSLNATDSEASLVAEWLVYRSENAEPVTRRISLLQNELTARELKPAQIAPAYSELFYQLSQLIAAAITSAEEAG